MIKDELKQIEDDLNHELDKFYEHSVDPSILVNRYNSLSDLLDSYIDNQTIRTRKEPWTNWVPYTEERLCSKVQGVS